MKKLRTWLIILILAVAAGGGAFYLTQGKITLPSTATATATPTSYTQNVQVQRGNITASISPTGDVYAVNSASLSFRVTATILELNAKAGQVVKKGDVLAKADTTSFQRTVDQAQADLLSAQDDLTTLQDGYTDLDIRKAKLTVAQAEASVAAAKQAKADLLAPDLDTLKQSVSTAQYDLESARLNLDLTKINTTVTKSVRDLEYTLQWYDRAIRDLQAAKPGANPDIVSPASNGTAQASLAAPGGRSSAQPLTLEEAQAGRADTQKALTLARLNATMTLESAQSRVTQAIQKLADAQDKLKDAQAGPDAVELAQADNTIVQAQAKLAKAQDDLKTMQAGPDKKKVELAQAKVDAAKATLAQAQANLLYTALAAPFNGTIIAVNVEAGDDVTSSKVVLTMADLSLLQVRATIDETKITQVKVDQVATITFDALPGKTFKGKVLEVPVQGTLSNNVVNYAVPISLENLPAGTLKPGMTANITLVTGSKQNVLLLPAYAVQQTTDGVVVNVLETSGQTTQTPVQTGLTNGVYVEITRGLNEGDTVVATLKASTTQQNFGGGGAGNITFFGSGGR